MDQEPSEAVGVSSRGTAPLHQVSRLDGSFLEAAETMLTLLGTSEVAARWNEPSALPKMSVGALACHLGRQPRRAAELLPASTDQQPLPEVDDHYRQAPWVRSTSLEDAANDRSADDAEAELGVAALLQRVRESLAAVCTLLNDGAAQPVVFIPWQGWALRRDNFLLTRMLEIVVHSADLAASLDVPMPEFAPEVFEPVRDLLVRLAVAKHGQQALVSTLTRTERQQPLSAF
ncbi:maleylpyruvate isomerase N-terminal domain-containing protein [Nakamurella aerolata]|uniref:Mycothiol-dependent maleylpyruvate isomerase metal-binding domain-containing protein n=1 Tax=Nakamurella aerolata TaxID=1656892 RepID=A0A849AI94_9ACTN|nr:hypothetical protein [Nakamurella aerolata]